MARALIILGAGASAPFGVPTLQHVFQDTAARKHLAKDRFLAEKLNELFWKSRGHTLESSHLGLSAEEILTLVRDYEHRPRLKPLMDESEEFRRSLYVLIKKAVYDGKTTRGKFLNPLIEFMGGEFMRREYKQITWASFNWDCIFEGSFWYASGPPGGRINPGLVVKLDGWWGGSTRSTFLKLHGGVNWWYEEGKLIYLKFGSQPDLEDRWKAYEKGTASGSPVILEPSYYKYEDPIYEHLKPQWEALDEHLLEAEIVVIIGYSLPEADVEARRRLTIGFQSNPTARFLVVDRAKWVCDRYKRLFGTERLRTVRRSLEDVHEQLPEIIGQEIARVRGAS